jgi:hypothetical protein
VVRVSRKCVIFIVLIVALANSTISRASEIPCYTNVFKKTLKNILQCFPRPILRTPSRNECFGILGGITLCGVGVWGYKHWRANKVMMLQNQAKTYFLNQERHSKNRKAEAIDTDNNSFEQQCTIVYHLHKVIDHDNPLNRLDDTKLEGTFSTTKGQTVHYNVSIKDGAIFSLNRLEMDNGRLVDYGFESVILSALKQSISDPALAKVYIKRNENTLKYIIEEYSKAKVSLSTTTDTRQTQSAQSNLSFREKSVKGYALLSAIYLLCENKSSEQGLKILDLYKEYLASQSIDPDEYKYRNKQWLQGEQGRKPLRDLNAYKSATEKELRNALFETKFTPNGLREPISIKDLNAWYSVKPQAVEI